jgi:hypothetical protein
MAISPLAYAGDDGAHRDVVQRPADLASVTAQEQMISIIRFCWHLELRFDV